MRDLAAEELEEAVELVGVAPQRGVKLGRIGVRPPPASAPRAAAGRRTARRVRGRAPRRPRRSAPSSSSTSFQTRPRSARSGRRARARDTERRPRVARRCLRATAKTPSTARSAASSAMRASRAESRAVGRLGDGRRQALPRRSATTDARGSARRSRRAAVRRDLPEERARSCSRGARTTSST